MAKLRDHMSARPECLAAEQSVLEAALLMRRFDVGVLPICGPERQLIGILTDRDIVFRVVAEGRDPGQVRSADLAIGEPISIDSEAEADEALRIMAEHQIRRLPVLEGGRLVGMISVGDLAQVLDPIMIGDTVRRVCAKP